MLQVLLYPDDISISSFPFVESFWKIKILGKKFMCLWLRKWLYPIFIFWIWMNLHALTLCFMFSILSMNSNSISIFSKNILLLTFLFVLYYIFLWCVKKLRGGEKKSECDPLNYLKIKNLMNKLNTRLNKKFNGSFLRY